LACKPIGFTDVRVKVDMECEGISPDEINALVTHVKEMVARRQHLHPAVNLEVGV